MQKYPTTIMMMGMSIRESKAWAILTPDEQMAITLGISWGKSSWEAGEIMHKSHYKYLELRTRSEKYLRIFTSYFTKYDSLFPADIAEYLAEHFKEYLVYVIIDRIRPLDAINKVEDKRYWINSSRARLITESMGKLRKLNTESSEDLYNLIMDFDRWSATRILPKNLQEPSAYKRRNKNISNSHLKNLVNLPLISLNKIIKKWGYEQKLKNKTAFYAPLISMELEGGFYILRVINDKFYRDKFNELAIPVYDNREDAEVFARLVSNYFLQKETKTPVQGQKFWPSYREMMGKAINHDDIKNISRSKYYLDNALI